MAYVQRIPMVNPNDEYVFVTEWRKADDEKVQKGEIICEVETSKAVLEIEAESSGFLKHVVEAGREVRVGEVIGLIKDSVDENVTDLLNTVEQAKNQENKVQGSKTRGWTKKAEILARKHGLDVSKIPAEGVVKEADVEAFLKQIRETTVEDLVEGLYPSNLQQRILILGGGKGAVQTIDIILRSRRHKVVGILDDNPQLTGKKIMGYPILGPISKTEELWKNNSFDELIISFSNDLENRAQLFEEFDKKGIPFTNVIDPTALICSNVHIGRGNLIMANSRIGACTIIKNNNFLSAYVNIEHHNIVGSHCTFGPGVATSSRVKIGNRVKFGTGIFIEPGVEIGEESIIASGSVLTSNIPAQSIVKAVISTKVRKRTDLQERGDFVK